MKKRHLIAALLVSVLATACGNQQTPNAEPNSAAVPEEITHETLPPVETAAPNCLDEVSPIGQSIADDFDFASYEMVMTWFCNGAEFEDILVALETETMTDTTAAEILQMFSDGFTWEEIWLVTGLVD